MLQSKKISCFALLLTTRWRFHLSVVLCCSWYEALFLPGNESLVPKGLYLRCRYLSNPECHGLFIKRYCFILSLCVFKIQERLLLLHKNSTKSISLSEVILTIHHRAIQEFDQRLTDDAFCPAFLRSVLLPACAHSVLPERLPMYSKSSHQQAAAPAAGNGESLKHL